MASKGKGQACCPSENKTYCKVQAMVSVDERGQMVLPKELRERAGIHAGDKIAVTSWEKDGKICCISLTKAEDLAGMVKATLSPIMKEIL